MELPSSCPWGGPASGQDCRPYDNIYSGYFGFILGHAQPREGTTADILQDGTFPPQYHRTPGCLGVPAFQWLDMENLKAAEGVPGLGGSGGGKMLQLLVGVPPAHGCEGRRILAAMWQQPLPQGHHGS